MVIKCDICNVEFELKEEDIKQVVVEGICVVYFQCNGCKEKYITSCIDYYVTKEKRKLKSLDKKLATTTELNEREKLMLKSRKLLKHLKTHSDRLKIKVWKLL